MFTFRLGLSFSVKDLETRRVRLRQHGNQCWQYRLVPILVHTHIDSQTPGQDSHTHMHWCRSCNGRCKALGNNHNTLGAPACFAAPSPSHLCVCVCTCVCFYVCMCVCMYVCVFVCMFVCLYVCIVYVCIYICKYCVCVCVCARVRACLCVCGRIWAHIARLMWTDMGTVHIYYVSIYIYIYICVCVCIYIYIYIYIYMRVYI